MKIYDEVKINDLYETNKKSASNKLKEIEVFCGNEPNLLGLNRWVMNKLYSIALRKN